MSAIPKPLVIYHGNCADGFTSAWLANMYYRAMNRDDGYLPDDQWYIEPHAGIYGEDPPDVTDRIVFILDFSYPANIMDSLAEKAMLIVNIDHHETAIKRLAGHHWPNVRTVFDITKSGALLTSLYFWPDQDPLDMVKLVSDRDLWQFKDKRSRVFGAGLFSYPYGLREWNNASRNIEQVCAEGAAVERKHHKDIAELVGVMVRWEMFGNVSAPTVNLPYTMASDACALLLEMFPEAPFAASWYLRKDGKRVYSLRSRKGGTNVATLAEVYGGGGHANASGFAADVA